MKRYLCALLVLPLVAGFSEAPADGPGCDAWLDQAEELRAMRDHDAAAGARGAEQALARLARSGLECPSGEAMLRRARASNLHILGRNREALEQVDVALERLAGIDDPDLRHLSALHLTAGVAHWELEQHDEAIGHYLRARRTSEQAGDLVGAARAAGNLGNLYSTLGDLEEARAFHERALAGFERAYWTQGVAGSLINLGALAERQARAAERAGESDSAREAYREAYDYNLRALALFEALENPRGIAYAASNIATALESLGQPEQALGYHERSLELRRRVGDSLGEIRSLETLASTHQALGNLERADELLEEAEQRLPPDNLALAEEVAERRVSVAEAVGDYQAALEHQREVARLRREISREEMGLRVEQLRQDFESEQHEHQLDMMRSEAQIADLQLKRQRAVIAIAVLTAVLLLVSLGFVLYRYRQRVSASRALDRASRTDMLTRLPNRRDMIEHLSAALARAGDNGEPAALLMVDLDGFKQVNDSFGHRFGDQVLVHLAGVLRDAVRGRDVVARWGGEEFLVLLPETDLDGALSVAENLRVAVENEPPTVDDRSLALTITVGVSLLHQAADIDDAVARADEALYRGKEGGRNQVVVADGAREVPSGPENSPGVNSSVREDR